MALSEIRTAVVGVGFIGVVVLVARDFNSG